MTCPTCGAAADPTARFCSSCGSEIRHLSDERRVVTVLFGDLVGFTSLSETRDPETVKNLVDHCFARLATDITAFGGTVDKVIGDAIVALFGAPMAHEDDAERAVRAALRMQQTLEGFVSDVAGAELRMRIGVNTGEVLVGALRAGGDYTAMGDVVNTAARLQTAAPAGEVLVGEATFEATRQVIDYEPRGSLQAKGREAPVPVWVARRTLAPPGSRPRQYSVPLVGRDSELSVLEGAMRTSMATRRASHVLLVGDAGLGKTRLTAELAARAVAMGGAVLEGRCLPYGEANAWWPIAEAVRRSCWIESSDSYDQARRQTLDRVNLSLGSDAPATEKERVATGLLHLMGFEDALSEVEPANARDEGIRSLVAYIEGFARQNPILIIFSDVHWADDVVLELTDLLLERLARTPVTIVATAREQLLDRWTPKSGRHNAVRLHLDPLGAEAATKLLTSLLGSEPSPELAHAILERSGGNPFFIEELVWLMSESSTRVDDGDVTSVPILPATLRGLVAARLDSLAVDQRTILQDAAVLGPRGQVRDLQTMAAEMHQRVDVDAALASLVADDLFELDLAHWSFRSDLVREVAYATLTKSDRAERHHGIATYIENHHGAHLTNNVVDRLANHYGMAAALTAELGGPIDEEMRDRAVYWLGEAARNASESEVLPLANRLFTQALNLIGPEPSPRRRELLLGRATTRTEAWELDQAQVDSESVRAEAAASGDAAQEACAVVRLGEIAQKRGRLNDALDLLADAVGRFEQIGNEAGLAEALRLQGMTQLFSGDLADAERSVLAAQRAFRSCQDRQGDGWALQNLAWIAFVQGRLTDADERLQKAVAAFGEVGDAVGKAWAMGLLGFVRMQQGRVEEAEAIAGPILAEARERGDKWATGIMTILVASLRLWAGQTDAAAETSSEAFELFLGLGDGFGLTQAASVNARALAMVGRVADGLSALERARPQLDAIQGAPTAGMLDAVALTIGVQAGDAELASHWSEQLADRFKGVAAQLNEMTLMVALALAALQKGDGDHGGFFLGLNSSTSIDAVKEPEAGGPGALLLAAAGRPEEAERVARSTFDSQRATYLDLVMAEVALALVLAGGGDPAGRGWAAEARSRADSTQDRLAQLMTRVALVAVTERLEDPGHEAAVADAERMRRLLGIRAEGWATAFGAVLAGTSSGVPA